MSLDRGNYSYKKHCSSVKKHSNVSESEAFVQNDMRALHFLRIRIYCKMFHLTDAKIKHNTFVIKNRHKADLHIRSDITQNK